MTVEVCKPSQIGRDCPNQIKLNWLSGPGEVAEEGGGGGGEKQKPAS